MKTESNSTCDLYSAPFWWQMFSNINDNDQSSLMKTFTAGRAQITAAFVFIDADPDIKRVQNQNWWAPTCTTRCLQYVGQSCQMRGLKMGGEEKEKRGSCQGNLPELGYSWSPIKFQLMWFSSWLPGRWLAWPHPDFERSSSRAPDQNAVNVVGHQTGTESLPTPAPGTGGGAAEGNPDVSICTYKFVWGTKSIVRYVPVFVRNSENVRYEEKRDGWCRGSISVLNEYHSGLLCRRGNWESLTFLRWWSTQHHSKEYLFSVFEAMYLNAPTVKSIFYWKPCFVLAAFDLLPTCFEKVWTAFCRFCLWIQPHWKAVSSYHFHKGGLLSLRKHQGWFLSLIRFSISNHGVPHSVKVWVPYCS